MGTGPKSPTRGAAMVCPQTWTCPRPRVDNAWTSIYTYSIYTYLSLLSLSFSLVHVKGGWKREKDFEFESIGSVESVDKRVQIHKCLFYMGFFVSTVSTRLKVSTRGQTPPPPSPPTVDEPVFAAWRTPTGCWSILAPCCRELSGRTGVRRICRARRARRGWTRVEGNQVEGS